MWAALSGIFFMALTLAIVSFSCTGPILGSLLVGALNQNGGAVQLTVAMAWFWPGAGPALCAFCFVSELAFLIAKIRWMDEYGEDCFWIY